MADSFDTMVFKRQGEIISDLREQNVKLQQKIKNLAISAHFYDALIEAIKDDVMLQDEWRRFIGVLRLSNPDIPGLTKALSDAV